MHVEALRATLALPFRLRRRADPARERSLSRAVLDALQLLGLAFGHHESELREKDATYRSLAAELASARRREALAWEIVDLVGARFTKLPARHQPHYTPAQRFRILELKNLLAWSAPDAARVFLVCQNTILNWERAADQESKTVGSLVQPIPPVRRISDVVRRLVQRIAMLGFSGQAALAAHVTAAGRLVSARTVGRILRERPTPSRQTERPPTTHPVIARFVGHVWMMDSSAIQSFFKHRDFGVIGILDAHSRLPLAVRSYEGRPRASFVTRLLRSAVRAFGAPRYLITDRGREFDNGLFRKTCSRLGIVHRFGSTANIFATARLERFWRTMKDQARLRAPWAVFDLVELEDRLAAFLTQYALFRPHRSLGGATPAEAFAGVKPSVTRAEPAPRGRPGEGPGDIGIDVGFVESGRLSFPFLTPRAA